MTLLLTLHLTAGSAIISAAQLARSRDLWILVQCTAAAIRFCTCQIKKKKKYIYIFFSHKQISHLTNTLISYRIFSRALQSTILWILSFRCSSLWGLLLYRLAVHMPPHLKITQLKRGTQFPAYYSVSRNIVSNA